MRPRAFGRRRFLAGALPAIAAVPAFKGVLSGGSASHAEAMEQGDHAGDAVAHADHAGVPVGDVPAPGGPGDTDELLYPAAAEPHRPGRVRKFELVALDREIEVAKGVQFPAWTYNGTAPGPVIRATEDDLLRVKFRNDGSHPHTIHFHGIHQPQMDGVLQTVASGGSFTYEFPARPAGMHLYHCHTTPLVKHIARGLYGAFIIDPPTPRPPAQELVMVLSGFDTNGDGVNEIQTVNGRAFYYTKYPIVVRRSKTVRIYLANLTEYDLVNSFHLHGEFFRLYRTGSTEQHDYTDTVTLGQGERCILEIDFHHTGLYMFHAHQSEFAAKGWMGWFNVVDGDTDEAAAAAAASQLGTYADEFSRCEPCLGNIGAKALLKY